MIWTLVSPTWSQQTQSSQRKKMRSFKFCWQNKEEEKNRLNSWKQRGRSYSPLYVHLPACSMIFLYFFCMPLAKSHSFAMPCHVKFSVVTGRKTENCWLVLWKKRKISYLDIQRWNLKYFRTIPINLQKEEKLVQTVRSEMWVWGLRVLNWSFLTLGYYSITYWK